jgi:hypothetical protein
VTFRLQTGRRRREFCDRCGVSLEEGYTWPGLGIPVMLCAECTKDIEESVESYGEDKESAKRRFLDRLRRIGL